MEASTTLEIRRTARAGFDVSSGGVSLPEISENANDETRNSLPCSDGEETEDEESLFDLVLKSPDSFASKGVDGASKKDLRFIESPRDVFLSKNSALHANSKGMSPISLARSPPKLKAFRLGFKQIVQLRKTEPNAEFKASHLNQIWRSSKIEQMTQFSAKLREEELHVSSVFARDNSLRSKILEERFSFERDTSSAVVFPEKSSRDPVAKYLKLIKPFYAKVSKRQSEKEVKLKTSSMPAPSPVRAPANLSKLTEGRSKVGSFKVVARHSGQSRCTSALEQPIRRRDDSLLEQHDGIQGAILHCKESYNSSTAELTQLFRLANNPSNDNLGRNSCEELKRCSI